MPIGREIADNPASLAAASPAKLASSPSADSINSGMASSQNSEVRPVTVVPVDRKTICGSTAGDHRKPVRDGVTDALRQASGSDKGPRSQMAGQKNSRNFSEDGKGFRGEDRLTRGRGELISHPTSRAMREFKAKLNTVPGAPWLFRSSRGGKDGAPSQITHVEANHMTGESVSYKKVPAQLNSDLGCADGCEHSAQRRAATGCKLHPIKHHSRDFLTPTPINPGRR